MNSKTTEIKKLIEEITCCKYIGKLKVTYESDLNLWSLLLFLDLEQSSIILAYQGTYDKFKEFIEKEIKSRKLQLVDFWTALKDEPPVEDEDNDYDSYE